MSNNNLIEPKMQFQKELEKQLCEKENVLNSIEGYFIVRLELK